MGVNAVWGRWPSGLGLLKDDVDHPRPGSYVAANFEEGQLDVRGGQPVVLTRNWYGKGVKFDDGGDGSAFAVIPVQNDTAPH